MAEPIRRKPAAPARLELNRGIVRGKHALVVLTVRGPEKEVAFIRVEDAGNKEIIKAIAGRKGRPRIYELSEVLHPKASQATRDALANAAPEEVVIVDSHDIAPKFRGKTRAQKAIAETRSICQEASDQEGGLLTEKKIPTKGSLSQESVMALPRPDLTDKKK